MFNKKKIIELENKIEKLREKSKDNLSFYKSQIKILDARIFKIEFPIGKVGVNYSRIFYEYSYDNELQNIIFYKPSNFKSYKIIDNKNNVHIGLKFDDTEKYFIVDKANNVSVECTDFVDMNNTEWIEYKN